MATSKFQYGAYVHPEGQVNLSRFDIRPNFTPRGKQWGLTRIMHLEGQIIGTTQSAIITEISALIGAYATNNNKAVLLDNSGVDTPHVLDPADPDAVSPVRVIQRSWPNGGGEELATRRTFSITLAQDVIDTESNVVYYQDTVRYIGNGGSRYSVLEFPSAAPRIIVRNQYTAQRIIQRGFGIGLTGYVTHLGPMFTPPTAYELLDLRDFSMTTPEYKGVSSINYRSDWTYHFVAGADRSSNPPVAL